MLSITPQAGARRQARAAQRQAQRRGVAADRLRAPGGSTSCWRAGSSATSCPGSASSMSRPSCASFPGRAARGRAWSARRKAWVRRLDNGFFAGLTGGLPRLTTNLERGPDGVLRLTNLQLDLAQAAAVGGGDAPRATARWLIEAQRAAGAIWPAAAAARRADRAAAGRTDAGLAQRGARRARHDAVPGADRGRLRLSRQWPVAARAVHFERAHPAAQRRARDDRHCRAQRRGKRRARRAAQRSRRVHGRARRRRRRAVGDARVRARSAATSRSRRISARTMSASPGRRRSRCATGGSTARSCWPRGGRASTGRCRRAGCRAGAISLARLTAQARLVNGAGQVRASLAGRARPGVRIHHPRRRRARPHRADRAGGRSSGARLILDSAGGADAGRRRLGAGADADSLRRRARDRVGAKRRRARTSRRDRRRCRCNCSTCSIRGSGLAGWRAGGSTIAGRGGRAGAPTCAFAISAAPGWCWRRSRSTSASRRCSTGRRRRCARWRSATARPSAGRRRASRRLQAGPTLAALLNAPMRMQVRYQGPVDTLWRLSGVELFDLSGPIAIGADIGGRLVDPLIRGSLQRARRADRKRGDRDGDRAVAGRAGGSADRGWR